MFSNGSRTLAAAFVLFTAIVQICHIRNENDVLILIITISFKKLNGVLIGVGPRRSRLILGEFIISNDIGCFFTLSPAHMTTEISQS